MLKDRTFTMMRYEWVPDDKVLWERRSDELKRAWELNRANLKRLVAAAAGSPASE